MAFIPYEKFDIITLLPPEEVFNRISANVGLQYPKLFSGFESAFNFTGYVQKDKFRIQKVIIGRNSFNPEINGFIISQETGCIVHIVMKLPLLVSILVAFTSIVILFTGIVMTSSQFETGIFDPKSLIFLFAIIFLYLLTTGCFKFDSNSSAALLQDLLEEQ
jgi:hypothetical protein